MSTTLSILIKDSSNQAPYAGVCVGGEGGGRFQGKLFPIYAVFSPETKFIPLSLVTNSRFSYDSPPPLWKIPEIRNPLFGSLRTDLLKLWKGLGVPRLSLL